MSVEEFVDKMKKIQNVLLEFLEEESEAEDEYENLVDLILSNKINNDRHEFEAFLQLINSIGNNHQRSPNFISKIERVLVYFKKDIQKYFSNSEIFKIFRNNKRILLFLIEEKMMTIDEYIFSQITSEKYFEYCEYFQPEIKPFFTKENIEKYGDQNPCLKDDDFIEEMMKDVEEDFYEKRRKGENDDKLYQLIRLDKVVEFVKFAEQRNLSLEIEIKKSKFETNQLLVDDINITLIKYASFYGSNDIIKYIEKQGVELTPSMWIYAIHSKNAELIKYLEENHVSPPKNHYETIFKSNHASPPKDDYETILEESIKCNHNEISNYIIDNIIKEEDLQNNIENSYYFNIYRYAVKFFNYCFFPTNMKYKNMFFYLCEFNYYTLVTLYLTEGNIDFDINATIKMVNV